LPPDGWRFGAKERGEAEHMMNSRIQGIGRRIQDLRLRCFGPRGAARLAAMLGISPATYRTYEKDDVPSAASSMNAPLMRFVGAAASCSIRGGASCPTAARNPIPKAEKMMTQDARTKRQGRC